MAFQPITAIFNAKAMSAKQSDQMVIASGTEHLSDYDFDLPKPLIAQHPTSVRSESRLLDARDDVCRDHVFNQLPELLDAADLIVFNDTRVIKARFFGEKLSGGKLELLVERVLPNLPNQTHHLFVAHMRISKKPRIGDHLSIQGGFTVQLLGRWPTSDGPLYLFSAPKDPYQLMQAFGHVPLPPYVEHSDEPSDLLRYQSIFAVNPGAVAAPTASLHFDESVITALKNKGIQTTTLTLHIGAGTFQPVKSENINAHIMHSERYSIPNETLKAVYDCTKRGGRIVAVGTTCVRALESWAITGQSEGETDIYIRPGFHFKVVDLMITNFHLPKSTLLMLISAFAGFDHMKAVYKYAIDNKYRFFSYGDAMLLRKKEITRPEFPHTPTPLPSAPTQHS